MINKEDIDKYLVKIKINRPVYCMYCGRSYKSLTPSDHNLYGCPRKQNRKPIEEQMSINKVEEKEEEKENKIVLSKKHIEEWKCDGINRIKLIFDVMELVGVKDKSEMLWFKCKESADIFGYKNSNRTIHDLVDPKYTITFEELVTKIRGTDSVPLTINEKNTKWMNEYGLYELATKSKMPIAKVFQTWLFEEVLPSIKYKTIDIKKSPTISTLIKNNDYIYNETKIMILTDKDGMIWFKNKEICTILGYADTKNAVKIHVDENDKMTFEKLCMKIGGDLKSPPQDQDKMTFEKLCMKRGGVKFTPPHDQDKNTIFINESGLYSLIMSSKKQEAKQFKHWVTSEVLPSIRKTGKYEMEKEYCFFDDHRIEDYEDKRVIYLLDLGVIDGERYNKLGKTARYFGREGEHLKHFGNCVTKHVEICDDERKLELKLKRSLERLGIMRQKVINGKNNKELFVTNDKIAMNDVIDELKKLNEQSKMIEYKSEDIRKMEIESENKKLEHENKKIDHDHNQKVMELLEKGKITVEVMLKMLK